MYITREYILENGYIDIDFWKFRKNKKERY